MNLLPRNRVTLLFILVAGAASLFGGFVTMAPNRLISGAPLTLWQVSDRPISIAILLLGGALLGSAFLPSAKPIHLAVLAIASGLLVLLFLLAGHGATALMAGARPATRIALGSTFWIATFCLAMIITDALQRLEAGPMARFLVIIVLVLPFAALAMGGAFDQLSILREYTMRHGAFGAAVTRHLMLVLASVSLALAIGVPLGVFVARKPGYNGAIFGTLNLLQTIPSVALFGLLIMPLAALAAAIPPLGAWGIAGIGAAPAIVALVLYSLLPVARSTQAGIVAIDPAIADAARGMGLTTAQIFWRIEIPLGMPHLLAGLRIVLVQAIGLAAVAALIGAGGLGTFIFQGIGQYATDLVLLGALPIIFLALTVDFAVTATLQILEGKRSHDRA
jgi:osmoprotectant transport system permease protein